MIRQYAKVGRIFPVLTNVDNFESTSDKEYVSTMTNDVDVIENVH